MKIIIKYSKYGDNGIGPHIKKVVLKKPEDAIKLFLWLGARVSDYDDLPARTIHEMTINGVKFHMSDYVNPDDWTYQIKEVMKKEKKRGLPQTMTGDTRKTSISVLEAIEEYCEEADENWGLVYSPSRWEKFIKWSKNKNA